jgi:fucose 4-O-acetylase-like acetyltransferase
VTTGTTVLGVVLVVIGVGGYVLTGAESITALIPAFIGLPVLVLGQLARRPAWRRHAIHAALALALLGLLGTLMNVAELPALLSGASVERPAAVVSSTLTALSCAIYLVLGVRSFVAARREPAPR